MGIASKGAHWNVFQAGGSESEVHLIDTNGVTLGGTTGGLVDAAVDALQFLLNEGTNLQQV